VTGFASAALITSVYPDLEKGGGRKEEGGNKAKQDGVDFILPPFEFIL
jgi:hypothetical protein